MTRQQRAFSLIELMIVIAIISILAALAVPSYQTYLMRAQTAEALALLTGAKTPTSDFYQANGVWPDDASFNVLVPIANQSGEYVADLAVTSASGPFELTATFKTTGVHSLLVNGGAGTTIRVYTSNGSRWTCGGGTTNPAPDSALPAPCK